MSLFHRMEEVFGSKKGGLANLNFLFIHMQTEENESKVFSDRFIGVILLIWNTLCFVRIYEGTSRVWPYRVCGILYGIVMPMVVISGNSNIAVRKFYSPCECSGVARTLKSWILNLFDSRSYIRSFSISVRK